jgi:hypothetical protein
MIDPTTLSKVCQLPIKAFARTYGLTTHTVPQRKPADRYLFQDNGASVLFVAHLDVVGPDRRTTFADTPAGPVVFSRALDDRLGAYIGLHVLPSLGIDVDVLLTTGEETGQSTAAFFDPPREYDWMVSFDRGHRDVVMYDYETPALASLVEDCGMDVGKGSFSDICYLDHLGVSGFNWDAGYSLEHTKRCHAFFGDITHSVACFADFYAANAGTHLPSTPPVTSWPDWSTCDHTSYCSCDGCMDAWSRAL